MPALQPPSMQIGALPQGASPLAPSGPPLAQGANLGAVSIVQQVSAATTTAAPTGITVTVSATKAGSFLVALVAYAQSGAATVPAPSGYTAVAVGSNLGNTLGGSIFYQANAPAGITPFAISGATGLNGIAVAFYELANVYSLDGGYGPANKFNNSGTNAFTPFYTNPPTGPGVYMGFECDVTGQGYTNANAGPGWVSGTTATSTTGATVVIIRPFLTILSPVPDNAYQLAGTLGGAIANGVCTISLLCATSGALTQPGPQAWPVASGSNAGWGALGGTKPGGAGGGQ